MPVITLHTDPACIRAHETVVVDDGTRLLDWLIGQYGPDGFNVPTVVFINQQQIDLNAHVEDGCPLARNDVVTIVENPLGVDPFTLILIAVAVTVAIAVTLLVPKPQPPELINAAKSPNNQLSGQTNIARAQQRIPDIFGKNRVYPDLILKTYFEYIGSIKYQTEYLCIGRGEYVVEQLKSGDTLLGDINGTTAQVYEPNTRPALLYDVVTSNEVNGQELNGDNAPLAQAIEVECYQMSTSALRSYDSKFRKFAELSPGDTFEIYTENTRVNTYNVGAAGAVVTGPAFAAAFGVGEAVQIFDSENVLVPAADIDGFYYVAAKSGDDVTLQTQYGGAVAFAISGVYTLSAQINTLNAGVYTVDGTTIDDTDPTEIDYSVGVTSGNFLELLVPLAYDIRVLTASAFTHVVGPFDLKTIPQQIWCDISAPRGLKDEAASFTVFLKFRLYRLDSGGSVIALEEHLRQINDSTSDERNYTFKFTPASTAHNYRVSVERITPSALDSKVLDLTKWTRLASVRTIDNADFGDITSVLINTQATEQATAQSERKFNAVVTRKLRTYNGAGGMNSTLSATSKFADAFVHMLTDPKAGNKPLAQIDLVGLYALQAAMDANVIYGANWGKFCYTFSDARVSVKDELKTICNAVRAFYYQDGSVIRVSRDQAQSVPLALFNKRNTRPASESRSVKFRLPSDYDGVTFEYSDETTGEAATIEMPEDLSATNSLKIVGVGIKNYYQAWNRAKYEYNKLRLRRVTVEKDVTRAGLLVSPNDLVMNADGTNIRAQNGEIIGIVGTAFETNEPLDFEGETSGSLVYTTEQGAPSEIITVTPRADGVNGFIKTGGLANSYTRAADTTLQVGSLFTFSPNADLPLDRFLIQSIAPGADGYVKLTMINYDPGVYAQDSETPT